VDRRVAREVEIFVYLIGEGVDVWRSVRALPVGENAFRIVSENPSPDDEEWEFSTGDTVECREKVFSGGGSGLVAVKRVLAAT
jgi:hypothetical protein